MKKMYTYICVICLFLCSPLMYSQDNVTERAKKADILVYGLESDVSDMISGLIKEKDTSFADEMHEIFGKTRNAVIKEKILDYGAAVKDAYFTKYALEILEDPYDTKKSTVSAVLRYVSAMEIKQAGPLIRVILDSDNEEFFDDALNAVGSTGGSDEALFLAEYLKKEDIPLARKQAVMRSLGDLQAVETIDALTEFAEDEDENKFVRMHAAEAIGKMKKKESIDVLLRLFQNEDPNIRTSAVKALSNYDTPETESVVLDALKDNYYKVRLEAVSYAEKNKIELSIPSLIFRAKNDPEFAVKFACYKALAAIQTKETSDFLISLISEKKYGENVRAKAAAAVLEFRFESCYQAVLSCAQETLKDDKLKNLRYAVGRELAKYSIPFFEALCGEYIAHADTATKGTGLDIFVKNSYTSLAETVKALASAEKETAVSKKAKYITETHQLFK